MIDGMMDGWIDAQSISCGEFWFAHVGGAQLNKHLGPRREFLVIGKGLLEAAGCLEEASIGTLVVCHVHVCRNVGMFAK